MTLLCIHGEEIKKIKNDWYNQLEWIYGFAPQK